MQGNVRVEARDGRNWCLIHETWWKACPCPGEITVPVRNGVMDKNDAARLTEFLDRKLEETNGA